MEGEGGGWEREKDKCTDFYGQFLISSFLFPHKFDI